MPRSSPIARPPIGPSFIERALKIGLTALQDATVSVDVDLVRDEFDKLLRSSEQANAKAAEALDQVLRSNFADGDGRLPRTLEKFLGDRGALRTFVGELFDETKRDSAIGRMRTLLGTYFDGDASKLALLLDPTRQHSPMHQFRTEVTAGLREAPRAARPRSRRRRRRAARSAPGRRPRAATSRTSSRRCSRTVARGSGDLVDRTGGETGELLRSKKGDFVLTVDPARTGGAEVRVVVEAKDRAMSVRVDPRGAPRGQGEPGRRPSGSSSSARPTHRRGSPRSTSAPATSTA